MSAVNFILAIANVIYAVINVYLARRNARNASANLRAAQFNTSWAHANDKVSLVLDDVLVAMKSGDHAEVGRLLQGLDRDLGAKAGSTLQ